MTHTEFETVIGLEVHIQLATQSKMFSGASIKFGAEPNTQACAVDLALPGVLPVTNKTAIEMAVKFGLAVGSEINSPTVFARKNYFYPDSPKGYQISQMDRPIVEGGSLKIKLDDDKHKVIGITRAHLEEDAGKSLHEDFDGFTGVDLNRAGTPLLEIVSEPELRSSKEAVAYLKTIHSLICYLQISDGNMAQGSMRCDANISVRPKGAEKLGTRCEIKNVNSFRFVEKAIEYEVERQIDLIEQGGKVVQQTRLYDAEKNETRAMRSKEEAMDYRYFPDPDLLPVIITAEQIAALRSTLPELPEQKQQRFKSEYELSDYDAELLASDRKLADFFEAISKQCQSAKLVANWLLGDFLAFLNKHNLELQDSPVQPEGLISLIQRIEDSTISGKIAKQVFEILWNEGGTVDGIIEQKGLKQMTDSSAIEQLIDEVITNNPNQVEQYRSGKDKLFGFFVGQTMKLSRGKANPAEVNKLLKQKLSQ